VTAPKKIDAKDVILIGELNIEALVLLPDPYVCPTMPLHLHRANFNSPYEPGYVPVRLQRDPKSKEHVIHITTPLVKGMNGEKSGGEKFGCVPEHVADVIGPMMAKVLIRLEASIERGVFPNVCFPYFGFGHCALIICRLWT
jgi:SWI/SNF-related matrix-associated actin-dependent regulator of chromatin subfamily A3